MNEYTFENLIMNPETPGLESLIGKEVYFNNIPLRCLEWANTNCNTGILKEIRKDCLCPFRVDNREGDIIGFACIIIKKEEPKLRYVPFENRNEFLAADYHNETGKFYLATRGIWLKHRESDDFFMVVQIWKDGVVLGSNQTTTHWDDLLEDFIFLDGTPCGKPMEE